VVEVKEPYFESHKHLQFGRRRIAPRVCVADNKPHIRAFLAETLEDLGFLTHQSGRASDLNAVLKTAELDLVVLGLLVPESDLARVLHVLSLSGYRGKVMLFGARASSPLLALHDLGERLGLAMLPPLLTPFRDSDLQDNLSDFLPISEAPSLPVDADEALGNKWLELWYQPKIDLHRMSLRAAEAQVRMRHPTWGIVAPDTFIQSENDPSFRGLSEFLIDRAMEDWVYFVGCRPPIELVIPLPINVFEDPEFVDRLCLRLPDHAALAKLTVEISSIDVSRDLALVKKAARRLETYNVALSIDDVMAETSWVDYGDFPIAELQVDQSFIHGCGNDRQKRAVCGKVVTIAERLGARTTAKGLDASADFHAVCDMGFDLGQGSLFAKAMNAHRFARTALRGRAASFR
jgi:EAL domain-containing protein (putative c-di-GMP-specific phosphodiesterase class I)/CheY-like chemotaxis protein